MALTNNLWCFKWEAFRNLLQRVTKSLLPTRLVPLFDEEIKSSFVWSSKMFSSSATCSDLQSDAAREEEEALEI